MVPVACDLACRVRDGDAEFIGRLAESRGWDTGTVALLVVLAAMVPVDDASPNDLLAWTGSLETVMEWRLRQDPLPSDDCRCPDLEPCGTYAAWMRHKRHGEDVDEACDKAYRDYQRTPERRRQNREAVARHRARMKAGAAGEQDAAAA